MTDRELLTRAAEAAGLRIEYWAQDDYPVVRVGENNHGWNPLKFNSDALGLMVRLEMDVFVRAGRWTEAVAPMGEPYKAMHGVHGDAETATRFAITMAALSKPTGNPADWAGRMRKKLDDLRKYDDKLGGPYRSVTMFVLKDEVRTARKFYHCDASEMWRTYGPPENELTADERLVLDGVKADKWKIRPGQRYRCAVFRDGRELVTQRARLDMDNLCQKHDLYDDA